MIDLNPQKQTPTDANAPGQQTVTVGLASLLQAKNIFLIIVIIALIALVAYLATNRGKEESEPMETAETMSELKDIISETKKPARAKKKARKKRTGGRQ